MMSGEGKSKYIVVFIIDRMGEMRIVEIEMIREKEEAKLSQVRGNSIWRSPTSRCVSFSTLIYSP